MKKNLNKIVSLFLAMLVIFSCMPAYAEHEHKASKCGGVAHYYDRITEMTHTYVTAEEDLCGCGEVVGYVEKLREEEVHSFAGGKCSKCGYRMGQDSFGSGETTIRYEGITSTTHTIVSGTRQGGYVSLKKERKVAPHEFNGDICIYCGYDRHEHKGGKTGKTIKTLYKILNNSSHRKINVCENLCIICGKKLSGTIEKNAGDSAHNYVKFKCTACGHLDPTHKHTPTYSTYLTEPVYTGITNKVHTKCVYVYEECECGKIISEKKEKQITEAHEFSGRKCTQCGYTTYDHAHNTAKSTIISQSYSTISESLHNVVTVYQEVCSCGEKLNISTKEEKKGHTFENGFCTLCGQKQPHVHKASRCGVGGRYYENLNSETHTYVTYDVESCECGYICRIANESRTTSEHQYEGSTCVKCGYTRHVHAYDVQKNRSTDYEIISDEEHVKKHYTGDYYCECGVLGSKGNYYEITEQHKYDNNVCVQCNHVRHQHITVEVALPEAHSTAIDEEYHLTVFVSGGAYCTCGEYILQSDSDVTFYTERHTFDGIYCSQCGFDASGPYIFTAIKNIILGDFSDGSNVLGAMGSIITGGIPIVGTVADTRDLVASIIKGDTVGIAANLAAFIPFLDGAKYSDEVRDASKALDAIDDYTDEAYDIAKKLDVISDISKNSDIFNDITKNLDGLYDVSRLVLKETDNFDEYAELAQEVRRASSVSQKFNSFKEFKKAYGAAGDGREWHHIVEQSQALKSGFDISDINDAQRIVSIDKELHRKISGYYGREVPGTDTRFRDFIAEHFTFEEQEEIGEIVLKMFGVEIE